MLCSFSAEQQGQDDLLKGIKLALLDGCSELQSTGAEHGPCPGRRIHTVPGQDFGLCTAECSFCHTAAASCECTCLAERLKVKFTQR